MFKDLNQMVRIKTILLLMCCGLCLGGDIDLRQETVRLMERAGMDKLLDAPLRVQCAADKPIAIVDEGIFTIQHTLLTPGVSAEPNVVLEHPEYLSPTADKLLVAVHGWLDKGQDGWPGLIAQAVFERTDPNEWLCASFEWRGGAVVVTSVRAAEYARDVAGPRLAAGITALNRDLTHIHLVGHSAGAWAIHAAARRLAQRYPEATFHLTFLDAYVPSKWNPDELGVIFLDVDRFKTHYWADHYYTRDITWKVTEQNLKNAHNVDITATAPLYGDHEFPHRWYLATITGAYHRWDEKKASLVNTADGLAYGYPRSRAAGRDGWELNSTLPIDRPAVVIRK